MRASLILAAAVLLAGTAVADDKSDRERRVRVALALAAAPEPVTCGQCREDVQSARADAVKDRKPLVLFVGGPCDGLGKTAEAAGAIPAKAPSYSGDDRPAAEKRIVVLEPKADGSGLMIAATLPAASSKEKVAEEVKKATPGKATAPAPAGQPLNWSF